MSNRWSLAGSIRLCCSVAVLCFVTPGATGVETPKSTTTAKKIVILAGAKSHGPEGNGAHEYPRSARLLKTMLDNVDALRGKIVTEVHFDGWPKDEATLDDAATILTISDGQDGDLYSPVPWMTPERIKVIEKQMARGCGFMTFHFSTFAPDDYGEKVVEWGGGYFDWQGDDGKRNWYSAIRTLDSEAKVGSPGHPVTRGLDGSFKLRDEFYYKIRFRDGDERLKPILLVPELGGGALEQTVAWAVERKDGGRGFCTTCGHFYDNWEHPQFRKLILNALVWTAGVDVPEKGIDAKFYSDDEVKAHLAGEAKSIKVVIVTGHQYPGHVWRETTLALEDALRKDPRIDVVSIPDPEFLASEKLHDYDAMVLNYCNWERPGLSDAAKENFVKYLRDGGGLVLVHFTNGAFHYSLPKAEDSDWPEFRKICRRVWNHQASKTTKVPSGHDAYGKFHVNVADAEHPITRGLGGFDTIDELYYQQDGEEPIHVVATARSKVTGKDEPMAFVYEYGQGRVFQSVLGHAAESLRTLGAAALFRRGAAWAAGKTPIAVSDDGAKLTTPDAPARAKELVAGRFGTALDAATGVFLAEHRDEYSKRPFTIECWARLAKKDGYNVLIACETKGSSRHWEIFTMPQNGHFTAYLPGHSPDHVRSSFDVCDDRWHHLAMTHAVDRVELFVDGKRVAEQEVKRLRDDGPTGKLAIGGLVEGGIGCSGLIDDVRLSTGVRAIDRVPDEPHAVDDTTVGLWRLDQSDAGKIDDESKLNNALSASSIAPPASVAGGNKGKIEGHWGEDAVGFRWTEGDSVDGRWNAMDVGPFLASVLPLTKDFVVAKGLSIKVGDKQQASVGYDLQSATLRGAWTGGFLRFDPARYGVARSPLVAGELQFVAPQAAWSPGHVQYRGLHQHGRRVTLAYQVGGVDVRESPWASEYAGQTVFTRTLKIAAHRDALTLTLAAPAEKLALRRLDDTMQIATAENDGKLAVWSLKSSAAGAELVVRDGRLELNLAASEAPLVCQLAMVKLPRDQGDSLTDYMRAAGDADDLDLLLRPGPSLWPEPIATQGRLGTGGPYVVDTLTIPFENPYKALIFIGGHDFFTDGDIAVCTLHGDVWRVGGVDDTLRGLTWRRMATGLHQPLGLKIVDDQVYVLGRDQITRLFDSDRNGEADYYECFTNAMRTSTGGHDYAGCLETDSHGNFYFISAPEGVVRVSPDGKKLTSIATGFRNPIGLSVGPDDTITAAPQEGDWTPASAVFAVREGGYYGYGGPRVSDARPLGYDPPLCWIPRLVDNSSGGQVWATSERWGPLAGQLFSLSFGRCWMLQTLRENLGDVVQGGTVQWPLSFESGVMRGRFSPRDGQLYVSGLKGWVSSAARDGCLQRVRYTGGKVHLPVAARTLANGFELTFAEPLERELAEDVGNYAAQAWNYRYGGQYGSPEYKVSDPQAEGRDDWQIASATLSDDGRRVFLELPEMRPVMQLAITWQLRAASGEPVNQTLNYTINAVGTTRGEPGPAARRPRPGALSREVQQRLIPGVKWSFGPTPKNVGEAFSDTRVAPLAALYVGESQTVSPRLDADAFRVRGETWLNTQLNVDAFFELRGTGVATLSINGKLAAKLDGDGRGPVLPVRLRQGFNRLEIDYQSPLTGDAALRLYWRGKTFPWETVPPALLSTDPLDEALSASDQFRAGRELFATRRCANCHALPRDFGHADMPEMQSDAPNLSQAGDRLSREWIHRWLLDPHTLRDHVAMPRLFDAARAADRQAAADIAAFLTNDRDKALTTKNTGDDEHGQELYESLGCIQCHRFTPAVEHDSFDRISLHFAAVKFSSLAALSEYLQAPHRDYKWTRMPDFRLSAGEADDLAQFIRSRSIGKFDESAELASADAKRGERQFAERRCQQCHIARREGTTAVASLASVLERHREHGCLTSDNVARGKAPDFAFLETERAALVAFCRNNGQSLLSESAPESAQRLTRSLRCSACHDREQRNRVLDEESELGSAPELLPSLTWAGEKLYTDWMTDQIGGRIADRTRPWLAARMPAFGPYAESIATGLAASHGLAQSKCVFDVAISANLELAKLGEGLTQKEHGLDCRLCHALGKEDLRLDNRAQGIGFSFVAQRLRPEFYYRWMIDPTRIDPQTAMPRFSLDGVSTKLSDVLNGDAREQYEAVWLYLQTISADRNR